MKTLSFVIPAYNSSAFLDRCISSMLCEAVADQLDIVIVNDGSTDDTADIAQKYCEQYPGVVRLISQENRGHGGALNTGCAAAEGKYLKVIDADDWVVTENLPVFVQSLEKCEHDVVLTHYRTINISNGEIRNWKTFPVEFGKGYSFSEIMTQWKNFDRCLTFHGITYRTAFYRQMGIQLSEHVFYEDHEFATFPCCYAEDVLPLDLFVYDYRIGDQNQSVSDSNQLKRIGHLETVLDRMRTEHARLTLSQEDPGRHYVQMKTQGLLMSYLLISMLLNHDKRSGRRAGKRMMDIFRQQMPQTWCLARKQYGILRVLNLFHVSRKQFDQVLRSHLYNKLRNNRGFD